MAILKSGNDEYEVCFKRYPEKTYFDEYVKTGDREKSSATSCDRYIIGEDGVRYTIEVTLKKGFSFGEFDVVQALLFVSGQEKSVSHKNLRRPSDFEGGIKEDMKTELEYADITFRGSKMLGARFGFRSLAIGDKLVKETDIKGITPESLGFFQIVVCKIRWDTRRLTDKEYKRKLKAANAVSDVDLQSETSRAAVERTEQLLWDAQKVDEESFSKDGIVYALSFIGGTPQVATAGRQPRLNIRRRSQSNDGTKPSIYISRTEDVVIQDTEYNFNFYYRTSEFLQQTGIVKYPPPLFMYAWKDLDKIERRIALKELQVINKEYVIMALEAKTGKIRAKFGTVRGKDEPKEWRAWSKMSEWEKEEAFESLRKSKKADERGEAIRQYDSCSYRGAIHMR